MKRFFFGLGAGLFIGGAVYFVIVPRVKQTGYDGGYAAGVSHGVDSGVTVGIARGVEQVHTVQQKRRDSVAIVEKQRAASAKAVAARKPKYVEPVQQNWHVINGKIEAPIMHVRDTAR